MHFSVYRTQIWSPLFCHHFQYMSKFRYVGSPTSILKNYSKMTALALDSIVSGYSIQYLQYFFKQKKAPHYATIAVCEQFFVVHTIYYLVRWRGSLFCLFIADEKALKLKKRSDDRDRRVTNTNNHCGAQMDNKRRRVNPPPHSGSYFATH